jgi:hypothetical protein
MGFQAGYQATNAERSNFLGQSAGYGATNTTNSNFLGPNAGAGATDANNSNFFGPNAGQVATNASNSNFFGAEAGFNAPNAYQSNFFGYQAGKSSSGNNVNAFGYNVANGNAISGITIFSNSSMKSYANRAAAVAAITVPNGAVVGNIYLYYNETTFAIEGVRL